MPQRKTRTSKIGQQEGRCQDGQYTAPPRDPLDVAGKINDLLNGYLCYAQHYLPLTVITILLIAIMILAAYFFIKD